MTQPNSLTSLWRRAVGANAFREPVRPALPPSCQVVTKPRLAQSQPVRHHHHPRAVLPLRHARHGPPERRTECRVALVHGHGRRACVLLPLGGASVVLDSASPMRIAAIVHMRLTVDGRRSQIYPRQNGGRQPALIRSLLTPPQTLINLLGNGPTVPSSYAAPGSSATGTGSYRLGGGTAYRPAGGAAATAAGARTTPGGAAAGGSSTATREQQAQHRWGRGTRLGTE